MKLSISALFAILTLFQVQVSAQMIDSSIINLTLKKSIENTQSELSNVPGIKASDIDQLMRYTSAQTSVTNDPQSLPRPKANNRKWYNSNWFYVTAGVIAASGFYMIIDSSGKTDPIPLPYPPDLP